MQTWKTQQKKRRHSTIKVSLFSSTLLSNPTSLSMKEECSVDYNALAQQQYTEMLTVCRPFYALSSPSSRSGTADTSNSSSITSFAQPFYLHPRLEDGLSLRKQQHQQQRRCHNLDENPQDPTTTSRRPLRAEEEVPTLSTVVEFLSSSRSRPVSCTFSRSRSGSNDSRTNFTSSCSCSSGDSSSSSYNEYWDANDGG
jgi:hypothetical protein